jgi:hypothetical protein
MHTLAAAMGLLWALEKGYYMRLIMCDTYVAAGVYWRISRPHLQLNKLRGVSLSGIRQERGELGLMMPWGH